MYAYARISSSAIRRGNRLFERTQNVRGSSKFNFFGVPACLPCAHISIYYGCCCSGALGEHVQNTCIQCINTNGGMMSNPDYTCSCQTLHAYRGMVSGNCMLLGLRDKTY